MVLIYYKVKNTYGWIYDNYYLIIKGDKPSIKEIDNFRTAITKMWGTAPVILNIMELEE